MEDERGDDETTDLDLNVEPLGSLSTELEEVYYSNILRGRSSRLDEVSLRPRNRWRRWRHGRSRTPPPETRNISLELIMNPSSTTVGERAGGLLVGEGSEVHEERRVDSSKMNKPKSVDLIAKALGKEIDVEKETSERMSFYDCNICLEIANDPVLTVCGHLFCWPCLYLWLHVHSTTNKACPVCQGEVKDTNITPIYGRGDDTKEPGKELGSDVPPRPQAQRVESLRQCIHRAVSSSFPIEEIIQRIGRRLDGEGEASQPHNRRFRAHDLWVRTNMLARRIINNRGLEGEEPTGRNSNSEQSISGPVEDIHDLTQDNVPSSEAEGSEPLPSGGPFLRTRSQRAASLSTLADRLAESQAGYFMGHPMRRNYPQSSPIEDRDSVSSIAAVIQPESPTVDTAAAEIDPVLSLSSSDTSRASSYVDSGVSRAPRRRRLN